MPGLLYNRDMSINLKEVNHAEEKIVVGGIKVLGSMEGPGVVSIKQNIDSLKNAVNTIGQKQENYWSSIASDNIITPVEKKTLKKEWSTIQTTYISIIQMATEKGILDTEDVKLYKKYYGELYDYLFKTIKAFDNMRENTGIPNISHYAQVYNNYYDQETIVQTILAASSSTFTVRNLTSLEETGTPNEIAMYNGQFYRYNAGLSKWEYVSAGKYKGLMSDIPDNVIDDYFLAASNFNKTMALKTSKGILTTADGTVITVVKKFVKGYLYECTVNGWRIISNRNDYRYIIATNDLVLNGDALSPGLDEVTRQAKYLGQLSELPTNPNNKEYFVYSGATQTIQYGDYSLEFKHGLLYQFNKPTWSELTLDTQNKENTDKYMTALSDLLAVNQATSGYFTNAFINNLISNESFIKKLATQVITLSQDPDHREETGIIQSDNYKEGGSKGFRLNYDGSAMFGGDVVFKGRLSTPSLYMQDVEVSKDIHNLNYSLCHILQEKINNPEEENGTYNGETLTNISCEKSTSSIRYEGNFYRGYIGYMDIITIYTINSYTYRFSETIQYPFGANLPPRHPEQDFIAQKLTEMANKAEIPSLSLPYPIKYTASKFETLILGTIADGDPHVDGALYRINNNLYISQG